MCIKERFCSNFEQNLSVYLPLEGDAVFLPVGKLIIGTEFPSMYCGRCPSHFCTASYSVNPLFLASASALISIASASALALRLSQVLSKD